jgi:hypothetical protein
MTCSVFKCSDGEFKLNFSLQMRSFSSRVRGEAGGGAKNCCCVYLKRARVSFMEREKFAVLRRKLWRVEVKSGEQLTRRMRGGRRKSSCLHCLIESESEEVAL